MNRSRIAICTLVAALLALVSGVGAFAQTTVGVTNDGNCYPFLCNDSGTISGVTIDYQQVYSHTAFSGPITISSLTFGFNPTFAGSSTVLSGTYDIYLSTTSAAVGALNGSNLNSNLGLDNTLVDVFSGGVNSNPTFTINLSTQFNYNPALGNLLLEVLANNQPNVPNGSGNGYIDADGTGISTSRAYCFSSGCPSGFSNDIGLVTTFNASPTPEPNSLTLFGLGLLGLAVFKLLQK